VNWAPPGLRSSSSTLSARHTSAIQSLLMRNQERVGKKSCVTRDMQPAVDPNPHLISHRPQSYRSSQFLNGTSDSTSEPAAPSRLNFFTYNCHFPTQGCGSLRDRPCVDHVPAPRSCTCLHDAFKTLLHGAQVEQRQNDRVAGGLLHLCVLRRISRSDMRVRRAAHDEGRLEHGTAGLHELGRDALEVA
jgi:hypothetical protein